METLFLTNRSYNINEHYYIIIINNNHIKKSGNSNSCYHRKFSNGVRTIQNMSEDFNLYHVVSFIKIHFLNINRPYCLFDHFCVPTASFPCLLVLSWEAYIKVIYTHVSCANFIGPFTACRCKLLTKLCHLRFTERLNPSSFLTLLCTKYQYTV
jgi:hypothetical protein